MPALILPYLLTAALSFGGGFYLAHELNAAKVARIELAVEQANAEAAAQFHAAQELANKAQLKALATNRELDKSHEAFIATVNDYRRQLDALSVPVPAAWKSRNGDVSAGDSAGISAAAAAEAELAEAVGRIVREEGAKGDAAGIYANSAHIWALTLNSNSEKKGR
ncbi:hypothetical protein [Methylobacter marinus]|uniref:hypothetical protein n=1 Tax=Methylobacter marinus TaxID=34058 RepID=UPI00036D08C6|nr:hypothetical protein [Methylobacter marinus]